MKNTSIIFLSCLVFLCLESSAQNEKPVKKTLAQFGVTFVNGLTNLSTPDKRSTLTSTGNFGNSKYTLATQIGVTFSTEITLYKKLHFFTSPTFLKYAYIFSAEITNFNDRIRSQNTIKQYHLPLQLLYSYRLGKSKVSIAHKIGVTFTSHFETIDPESFQSATWLDPYTMVDYYYYNVSVESSSIKKITPSLSGALAFKFGKPQKGNLEIGLSFIYNIKNATNTYIVNQVKYDATDDSLISDETEEISFTTKNTVFQFYITWYPKFLRITKKIK